MKHVYDDARRIAHNTLTEANRHLSGGKVKNARHYQMLTNMVKDATQTLANLDDIGNANPYTDTNIGYGANIKRHSHTSTETNDAMDRTMDAINRILPHIADDIDDDYYDDSDDLRIVNMPRWRSRRTGRFLPNLYGRGRVRRVRRRADMDDGYSDMYADRCDDRYDDMYDDRHNDRYDDRHSNRYENRIHNDTRRTAEDARQVAEEARRIADDTQRMLGHTHDSATPPAMVRNTNTRYMDARNDTQNDTSNDTHRLGPEMRR